MKKILILLVVLCYVGVAMGQKSKQNVAVYVTGSGDAGMNKVLGTKLVSEITHSGNYQAIERTDDFLRELSKEQTYQQSGSVDDSQISQLGKQFGAEFICVADITSVMNSKFLSSRLIDIGTAMVIAVSDYMENIQTPDDIVKAAENVASQLFNTFSDDSYASLHMYRPKERMNLMTQERVGDVPYLIKLNGNPIITLGNNSKTTVKVRKEGNFMLNMFVDIPAYVYDKGDNNNNMGTQGNKGKVGGIIGAITAITNNSNNSTVVPEKSISHLLPIDIVFGKDYYIYMSRNKIILMDEKKGKKEFNKIK
jgi:hypothetical protein